MRAFFQGWRRKAGCVALVMAIGLIGWWMRSFVTGDYIYLQIQGSQHVIVISFGRLEWGVSHQPKFRTTAWITQDLRLAPRGVAYHHINNWSWGEFEFGTDNMGFPFWFPALLQTLLSPYLILWKPRKRTANATTVVESPQE